MEWLLRRVPLVYLSIDADEEMTGVLGARRAGPQWRLVTLRVLQAAADGRSARQQAVSVGAPLFGRQSRVYIGRMLPLDCPRQPIEEQLALRVWKSSSRMAGASGLSGAPPRRSI